MKLSGLIVLASGINAENAYASNFQVTKTRASRLNIKWDVAGDDNADDWAVSVMDQAGRNYSVSSRNPSSSWREIRGLRPAQKYFITINSTGAGGEGEAHTFEAYTSPRGVASAFVSMREHEGVNLEWTAVGGADQYRIVDEDTQQEWFVNGQSHWAQMTPGESKNLAVYTVACGSDCANPPNNAYGKPFKFVATSVPPAPLNVRIADLAVSDLDSADARIAWTNPEFGNWDNIKIEYSPNDPPAKTETPTYAPAGFINDSTMINGLYQNTIYTFTVRFVSNNVEGPAESYTYAIDDFSFEKSRKPSTMTCKVPMYLRPENLRVKRDIFGDATMEVSWDHPKAKAPEGGYKLVFAPFQDIIDAKPWSEIVSSDQNTFTVKGHNYDPYEEYLVSVVALHDEYVGDANGVDFIASHFTGTAIKNERNVAFVAPDSCCGSTRHNSKDSSCCGGQLISDDLLCCRDVPYQSYEFKCCGNGNLVPVDQSC